MVNLILLLISSRNRVLTIPLFMGKLYIETNSFAISAAEFGFNLSNKEEAASLFIRRSLSAWK